MPDVILGNLPAATTPLTGAERVPMDQRVGGTVLATALTPGLGYAIVSVGTTNWVTCGVPAGVTPAVGLVFTCSAVGTGTGTAQQVETVDAAASDLAALAPPTNLSYDPATRLLTSSTGTDVTLPLAGPTTAGLLPPTNDPLSLASLTVTGTLTAPHIHGALAGPLYIHVRNDAGVSLPAGTTVHVVGNQGDTDRMLVVLARADNPDTLPANGILLETLAPNADGHAVNVGELTGFNTSGLTAGAQVFVALTGGLTLTRPATNPQAIATVGRVHSSTGSILVNASPVLSTVAFTGAYGDLAGRPSEISQGDAEAGSATVFSLWSAQRWRQAAATWWQSVTSAVGRSLVAAADAPAARAVIGAAGSGAITSSGLTMATARILARFTAGSGAVEETPLSPGFVVADGILYHEQWLAFALAARTSDAATGANVNGTAIPYKSQILAVQLDLSEAPAGANFVVDLNKGVGGTSVLSTKLSIDAGETNSVTAAVAAVISDSEIPANTYLSWDIDQVGATAGSRGKGPVAKILLRRVA